MKNLTRLFVGKAFTLLLALFFLDTIVNAHPWTGPVDLSGELHGAPYRIIVPENWNGTLLVYAHGYRDKANHPGEVDDRSANFEGLEPALLSFGYAVAATAYRDNGWVVEDGIQDTKDLTVLFRSEVAVPDRTILLGASMGTMIAFKSMERFGGIYDGAICLCAIGAGASRFQDSSLAHTLAYDILFGIPASWGTVGDVRDDIDDETEVFPKLFFEVSNPFNFPKFEFIRLVSGVPGQGIAPPPMFYPYYVFATGGLESRADLERRAGGPIVQNLNHNYTLSAAEKTYLAGLGVDADTLLAQMNARRNIDAPPAQRNFLRRNADYNGKVKKPVLTMHTIIDEIVPVSNELAYAATNAAAGRQDLLFQTYTNGVASINGQYHCQFTGPQIFSAIFAMDSWVQTGVHPTDASFPAFLGFVPGYVPPPFPQP
ncbi:MAG: hypothetical protein WBD22_00150 [Pyrinomonadaceae bacterium]